MQTVHIDNDFKDDIKKVLRADDMFISGGDIAFAGMVIGGEIESSSLFASHIASLSHIVTRIVLSERLAFVYTPGSSLETPTSYLLPLITTHCNTVQFDQFQTLVSPIVEFAFDNPVDLYGDELLPSVTQAVKGYAPWVSNDNMARALISEYGLANVVGAPYAPNPFVSQPFSVHAITGKTTETQMLQFIEDLRCKTSEAMNLLEGLHIYDLRLPVIFGAILRESSNPSDLIRVASQMNKEAKVFRAWCRNLDAIKKKNPDKYIEQLQSAQASLRQMATTLGTSPEGERIQVAAGGFGVNVPSPGWRKLLATLNVDTSFYRPRSFLLNIHSLAREITMLSDEIARVFRVDKHFAKRAAKDLLERTDTTKT